MLDDRDYMREPVYRDRPRMPPLSFTVALLIVNAVVFFIQLASSNSLSAAATADSLFCVEPGGAETRFRLATADVSIHARRVDRTSFQFAGHLFLRAAGGKRAGSPPFFDTLFVERSHRRAGANAVRGADATLFRCPGGGRLRGRLRPGRGFCHPALGGAVHACCFISSPFP